jgi:hypothetical protein
MTAEGWFDHNSWWLHLEGDDPDLTRFASAHESHHKQLQDSTSYGALTRVIAALAAHRRFEHLRETAIELTSASQFVHEAFATWAPAAALGWDAAKLLDAYPTYRRYYLAMDRLVAPLPSPYLRFHAVHAASRACLQTAAATIAIEVGLANFELSALRYRDHPDERFAALLADPPSWEAAENLIQGMADRDPTMAHLLDAASLSAEMFAPGLAEHWQAANEACYREVANHLYQAGSATLDHEGHLTVTPRLLAAANALIGGQGLGLDPGQRRDPSQAPAIVLRNIESEGFAVAGVLPAVLLPASTPIEANVADANDPHIFVTLRRTDQLAENYSLADAPRFDHPIGAFARRTVNGSAGQLVVELADVTDRSEAALSARIPVAIATPMSLLSQPEIATWTTARALASTVLIADVALAEHLRLWLSLPGVQFRYQLLRVESFGRVVPFLVGRIDAGEGASANLMLRPLTHAGVGIHRQAFVELDPTGDRVTADLALSDADQVLLSRCLAHIAGEEVRFPAVSLASGQND